MLKHLRDFRGGPADLSSPHLAPHIATVSMARSGNLQSRGEGRTPRLSAQLANYEEIAHGACRQCVKGASLRTRRGAVVSWFHVLAARRGDGDPRGRLCAPPRGRFSAAHVQLVPCRCLSRGAVDVTSQPPVGLSRSRLHLQNTVPDCNAERGLSLARAR